MDIIYVSTQIKGNPIDASFTHKHLKSVFMILPTQLDENSECASCYKPRYGGSMVFFLWQAALIAIELLVGKHYLFQLLGQNLPIPIRTAVVVCLGLPFAHFFLESYVKSDFFPHGQQALPMFLPL